MSLKELELMVKFILFDRRENLRAPRVQKQSLARKNQICNILSLNHSTESFFTLKEISYLESDHEVPVLRFYSNNTLIEDYM